MARISITQDEADKRRQERGGDALTPHGIKPGMVARWVRTGGHDPDGHMQRMLERGYVPVERTKATEASGEDPRLRTAQGTQLDGTVKRGDLMLMQISEEKLNGYRRREHEFTKSRGQAVLNKFKQMGGYDEKE